MTFGDLLTHVYRVLEDPGQFAWDNPTVALHLQDAVREVANKLGLADGRTTMDLVASQSTYELPAGIRRVNNIKILPKVEAGGTQQEPKGALVEVRQQDFEVVSVEEGEPTCYFLSAVAGTDEDKFEIQLAPTPDRNHTDGIIINYAIEYAYSSDDPATIPQKDDQKIPFPPQYDKIIIYKTVAGMLSEREDQADIQRSEYLNGLADRLLRPMLPVKSVQSYIDVGRAFP